MHISYLCCIFKRANPENWQYVQKTGFSFFLMLKIQRISSLQHQFSFLSSSEQFSSFYNRFLLSDLGHIHSAIPWNDLVKTFKIKVSHKGPKSYFSPKGKIALMFLKHYADCSDHKLIEQLNSNIDYQFFCDLHLGLTRLTNSKIVSDIRCELSSSLSIIKLEKLLCNYWMPYIREPEKLVVDATCYESELRYPTDQKLLWESVDWIYKQLKALCKAVGIKMPRSKHIKWKKRYIGYSKMRKKTIKKRRSLTRALLKLLEKFIDFEKQLLTQYKVELPKRYFKTIRTIRKVYYQQNNYFHKGEKPKHRIVSLLKDYIRPIVRGKEIKAVEFGAKVNKIQIDGISFIQKLSFENFNEGTQLKNSIYKAQGLTKTKVRVIGADAIYATNKNRVFITNQNIQTDFRPKGKPSKHYKQLKTLKAAITKERASRLEGSFGKEKEHYNLRKIKAKTKANEILWIFFGIHTANALEIGRRMQQQKQQKAA